MLLKLSHHQFVFTVPKLLRSNFKYNRTICEEVSKTIFSIMHEYYTETAPTTVKTGIVVKSGALQRLVFCGHRKAPFLIGSALDADLPFENARKIPSRARESLSEGILGP